MFGTQDRRGDRTQQTEQQQSACQWHGRSADSERKRYDRGDLDRRRARHGQHSQRMMQNNRVGQNRHDETQRRCQQRDFD